MIWKFRSDSDFVYDSGIPVSTPVSFDDAQGVTRLVVDQDGTITVKEDYSWDGCSPKLRVFDLGYIGTPDGTLDVHTGQQKTYYASLLHDALYQFIADPRMEYKRSQMDRMFFDLMTQSGFGARHIYLFATRSLGWVFHYYLLLVRHYNLS